jgi:hypothetical protein
LPRNWIQIVPNESMIFYHLNDTYVLLT